MSKITLVDVTNLQTSSAVTTINNNSDVITTAMDNTLSLDGTSPNQMGANLDMNSHRIINLPAATGTTEPVRLAEFNMAVFGTPLPQPPGGSPGQVQYNNAGVLGGMSGSSWNNASLALALTGATVTTSKVVADKYVITTGTFNAQVGTTYTLNATDNGGIVTLNNTNPITLTCPSGLGAGFSCVIIQLGTGQVNVATSGGAVLNSFSSFTHLSGQYAVGTLIAPTANVFILGGQIA